MDALFIWLANSMCCPQISIHLTTADEVERRIGLDFCQPSPGSLVSLIVWFMDSISWRAMDRIRPECRVQPRDRPPSVGIQRRSDRTERQGQDLLRSGKVKRSLLAGGVEGQNDERSDLFNGPVLPASADQARAKVRAKHARPTVVWSSADLRPIL